MIVQSLQLFVTVHDICSTNTLQLDSNQSSRDRETKLFVIVNEALYARDDSRTSFSQEDITTLK